MAATLQHKVYAKLNVPDWLRIDVKAWPLKPMPVTPPEPGSSLLIGVEYAGPRFTVLDVEWTVHLPYDRAVTLEWDTKRLGFLATPPDPPGGNPTMRDIAHELVWVVHPAIVRLASATGSGSFLAAYLETPYRDLVATARVAVDGLDFEVKPMAQKTSGPRAPKRWLDAPTFHAVLTRDTYRYEYFLAQADFHRDRRDPGTTIAWLATTLEVASYEFLGNLFPPNTHFNPKLFLGSHYPDPKRRGSLQKAHQDCYARCHELWGARHEVLHMGRQQIRLYNPIAEAVDRNLLRPIQSEDLKTFREAVETAAAWLRLEP